MQYAKFQIWPVSYVSDIKQFKELPFKFTEFPDNWHVACVIRTKDSKLM